MRMGCSPVPALTGSEAGHVIRTENGHVLVGEACEGATNEEPNARKDDQSVETGAAFNEWWASRPGAS